MDAQERPSAGAECKIYQPLIIAFITTLTTRERLITNSIIFSADDLRESVHFILSQQRECGAIPWYQGGKLDPWDHTEAAMALSVGGAWQQARAAYQWLADNQLDDGSWHAHYFCDDELSHKKETNFVAYPATGIWHHYLITGDKKFLSHFFPVIAKAINYVLQFQSTHGEIYWATNADNQPEKDALITACSSILRSLECACLAARTLHRDCSTWISAYRQLHDALLHKPERFDRTWESKARFSMDWYYPILAGIFTPEDARMRLAQRWPEFIEAELGCRCVSDEPWVTMAETSELVIALIAAGQRQEAINLFNTLHQWRDDDGGYWTGYVFRDKAIWPEEKTTWTVGAVILAADAINRLTAGSTLFTRPTQLLDSIAESNS